jgi:hypothetical protein
MEERSDDFALQAFRSHLKVIYDIPRSLTTWGFRLYFLSEERCAVHFIGLTNPSPRPGLNPRTLDKITSILTTPPPRKPHHRLSYIEINRDFTFSLKPFMYLIITDVAIAKSINPL